MGGSGCEASRKPEVRVERLLDRSARSPLNRLSKSNANAGRSRTERERDDRQVEAAQMAARERQERAERHPDRRSASREAEPRASPQSCTAQIAPMNPPYDEERRSARATRGRRRRRGCSARRARYRGPQRFDPERYPVAIHRLRGAEPDEERHEEQQRQIGAERCPPPRSRPAGRLTESRTDLPVVARRARRPYSHLLHAGLPSSPVGRSASTRTNTAKMAMARTRRRGCSARR